MARKKGRGARPIPTGPPVLTTPNILLIHTDDQEVDVVTSDVMPFLASRPGDSWVMFPNARLSTPLCYPARACLLTGQRADINGQEFNDGDFPPFDLDDTIGKWVQDAGYRTGMIGKYLNAYPWGESPVPVPDGWDTWFATGTSTDYTAWTCYDENGTAIVDTDDEYLTDRLALEAVDFITADDARPWFLHWNPIAPHSPFTPAARHLELEVPTIDPPAYNALVTDGPAWTQRDEITGGNTRNDRRDSVRTLKALDEGIETIFDVLDMDNTVVIFLTDNGFAHGRHRIAFNAGEIRKKNPFRWCTDPSLRIRYPGVTTRTETAPVSSLDITTTIAAMAGATPGLTVGGVDITALVRRSTNVGRTGVGSHYVGDASIPQWWTWEAAGWRYTEYATDEVELYDLNADPYELVNVAAVSANAAIVAALSAKVAQYQEGIGLPA